MFVDKFGEYKESDRMHVALHRKLKGRARDVYKRQVIGCLALTQGCGTLAAASFATLLCLASFAAGRPLARSWRLGEAAERERLALSLIHI